MFGRRARLPVDINSNPSYCSTELAEKADSSKQQQECIKRRAFKKEETEQSGCKIQHQENPGAILFFSFKLGIDCILLFSTGFLAITIAPWLSSITVITLDGAAFKLSKNLLAILFLELLYWVLRTQLRMLKGLQSLVSCLTRPTNWATGLSSSVAINYHYNRMSVILISSVPTISNKRANLIDVFRFSRKNLEFLSNTATFA